MRWLFSVCVGILTIASLQAQTETAAKPKKPPTPQEKAREILEKSLDTVAGAQPQVQVAGLLHLGELYTEFDKKRANEIFRQAFAAAGSLPDENGRNDRDYMMSQVASVAAENDIELGMELLGQMGSPLSGKRDGRVEVINQITRKLIQQKRIDRAGELIVSLGTEGEFAYGAAGSVIKSLPEGDPSKNQLFAAATTAYSTRPSGPFTQFVSEYWQQVPQPLAEAAVTAILNAVLDTKKKDDESFTQTLSTGKGSVSFTSRQNAELFNVLHVVRAVNPKKADELLETRMELREAVTRFPQGRESMKSDSDGGISQSTTTGSGRDPQQESQMRLQALANTRMQEALNTMKDGPDKALAIVKQIPLDGIRAQALSLIANQIAEKDPSTGKAVLTQCVNLLDEIKQPSATIDAYINVAEAAHKIHDEERARLALDRAITGATELYKRDVNAERPNTAPREYWPSTQSFRRIVYRAIFMYGIDGEYVLPTITDPDLHLLASIEMARSLLKKPARSGNVMFSSSKR